MKDIDETRNYFVKEINQNELTSKKHNKVCRVLNYIEYLLILISTVTGFFSIFSFTSLVGIPISITNSGIGLKICVITAGIKKYKWIIKKRRRNMVE